MCSEWWEEMWEEWMEHYLIVRIRIVVFWKQRVRFCLVLAIVKLGLICSNASLK